MPQDSSLWTVQHLLPITTAVATQNCSYTKFSLLRGATAVQTNRPYTERVYLHQQYVLMWCVFKRKMPVVQVGPP